MKLSVTVLGMIVLLTSLSGLGFANDDCEVCIKFLTRFQAILKEEKVEGENNIRDRLREECRKSKGKDNRFCYYIGGTDDAATGTIQDVTKPCGYFMPPETICKKLNKKDSQICELKYEKQIDWKTVKLNKMRVKQLKKILLDWGEECKGCVEKQDFISRIEELKPLYVRDEL